MTSKQAGEVLVGGQKKRQCAVARNFLLLHNCSFGPACLISGACKKTPWARKNGVKIIESCTSNQAALYAEESPESLIEKKDERNMEGSV